MEYLMKTHMKLSAKLLAVGAALLAFVWLAPLAAQAPVLYVWHDGNVRHEIWLQPDLLADFTGGAGARSVDASARMAANAGAARIYRVNNSAVRSDLAEGKMSRLSGVQVSPVVRSGGILRALPGGVIVSLNPNWTDAACRSWIGGQSLAIVKKLPVNGNFYLLSTPAGMLSLQIANNLHALPDVITAFPNWWVQQSTR